MSNEARSWSNLSLAFSFCTQTARIWVEMRSKILKKAHISYSHKKSFIFLGPPRRKKKRGGVGDKTNLPKVNY